MNLAREDKSEITEEKLLYQQNVSYTQGDTARLGRELEEV